MDLVIAVNPLDEEANGVVGAERGARGVCEKSLHEAPPLISSGLVPDAKPLPHEAEMCLVL